MPKTTNEIPGGLGDNKSTNDVDPKELKIGIEVEFEHTDDKDKATEIAMDHLSECPTYYTRLKKMEENCEEDMGTISTPLKIKKAGFIFNKEAWDYVKRKYGIKRGDKVLNIYTVYGLESSNNNLRIILMNNYGGIIKVDPERISQKRTGEEIENFMPVGKDKLDRREENRRIEEEMGISAKKIFNLQKISEKKWDPNPWAVCEESVGKKNDPEKYERCVKKVKKKQNKSSFNLKNFYKKSKKKDK